MTQEEQTTEVATVQKTEGGVVLAADFGDETEGFEGQTANDVSIPHILLLQDGSPQTKKKSDQHLEGAEPGMFFNNVTKQVFDGDEGLLFQICVVDHHIQEWFPRNSDLGKGFVARHDCGDSYVEEAIKLNNGVRFGKIPTEKGTELIEVYQCWGIIPGEPGDLPDFGIFTFASKKIRPYKDWNTVVSKFTILNPRTNRKQVPDRFAHLIRITSAYKTDGKGDNDYFNVEIAPANTVKDEETGKDVSVRASLQTPDTDNYQAAKSFRDAVLAGMVKQADADQDVASGGSDPGF